MFFIKTCSPQRTNFIHDTFARGALLVCNSGMALAFAAAAHAQTALAPAYPQFGPEKPIGAVIWTHGHSNEMEASKSRVECQDGAGPPAPVVLPAPQASVGRLER